LHKRHNALSFHVFARPLHLDMSWWHWGYQTIWPILKPILFFHGDTADLIQDDDTV
jgi:hypothetical protein